MNVDMTWTQYEVWAELDGHQELIETTHSKRDAIEVATKTFEDGVDFVQVFEETSDGDYLEIKTLSR
jgi:hypothetical protein